MRAWRDITPLLVGLAASPARAQEVPAADPASPHMAAVATALPESSCGELSSLPMSETPSDMLAGRFTLTLPTTASHASVPNNIMAAPTPEVTSSLYFVEQGGDRLGVVVNETFQLAGADLEAEARRYLADLPPEGAPWNVAPLVVADPSVRAVAYWPANLMVRGDADVWALGVLYAMPDGDVAHVSFRLDATTAGHGLGCTGYAAKLAASARAGGRALNRAAHEELVQVGGARKIRVPVPADTVLLPQPGPDFDVFYLIPLVPLDQPSPSLGVYVGAWPQELEPSNLPDVPGSVLGDDGPWKASDVAASTVAARQLRLERRFELKAGEVAASTDKKARKAKKREQAEVPPAPEPPPLYLHIFIAATTQAQLDALRLVAESMTWDQGG